MGKVLLHNHYVRLDNILMQDSRSVGQTRLHWQAKENDVALTWHAMQVPSGIKDGIRGDLVSTIYDGSKKWKVTLLG